LRWQHCYQEKLSYPPFEKGRLSKVKTKENKFARQIFVRILACCEVCSKKGKVSSQSEMNVSFFYFGQNLD
jgi:hypothetical protein